MIGRGVRGYIAATSYFTNFTSYDSNYWSLEDDCTHCSSGHGDECTHMIPSAINYNSTGATITTTRLSSDYKCNDNNNDKAGCSSGHMMFKPMILYGTITVKALWFPGTADQVNTSTGFIGLDSPTNEASITFGFHGKGWLGDDNKDFSHEFQTALYANVSEPHNRIYIETPNTDLAHNFNTYQVIWHPDKVEWKLNGETKRIVTNTTMIPYIPMQLKLHSRSGYCHTMPDGDTFYCQFSYFEFLDF